LAHDNADDALLDAMNLARAMTRKCKVLQSTDGGGKSVVVYEREKDEAFVKAIGRFIQAQRGLFCTGVDMNLDLDDAELIGTQTDYITSLRSNYGSTGENTAEGIFYTFKDNAEALTQKPLQELSVAIQGVGAVGAALVQRLADYGVADIRVADINQSAVDALCAKYPAVSACNNADILFQQVDILSPCSRGGLVDESVVARLQCKVLAPASNNTLNHEARVSKALQQHGIIYIPDFVLNSGGYFQSICERKGMTLQQAREGTQVVSHAVRSLIAKSAENGKTLWQNAVELYQ
jgi:leucine dehydrogenase